MPRPSTLEHRRPLASCSRTARQSSRGRGTKVTGAQSTLREHGLAPGALGLPVCPHSLHQCRQAGERQGWTPWGQGQRKPRCSAFQEGEVRGRTGLDAASSAARTASPKANNG